MKLALLGVDDEALAIVRWAVLHGRHDLVAAYDVGSRGGDVAAIAPQALLGDNWESLVLGSIADAVIVARGQANLAGQTGIADDERRADQLRKLAQAAVPLLVVCPACEAIVGFEIEMIRRDSGGVIVPYVPGALHPAVVALSAVPAWDAGSPVGAVEQIVFERALQDRSRDNVLLAFARDVSIIRQLIGTIRTVSAAGPVPTAGRDPLGPKPTQLPPLSNVNVHLSGEDGLSAHWKVVPAREGIGASLTVMGQSGTATLRMPANGEWTLDLPEPDARAANSTPPSELTSVFWILSHAASGVEEARDENSWLNACRDQEAAEAIDRSLARGRTIELFGEEHTEEDSFKGIMAMGGCLLLVGALGVVFLATIVEGLRLPLRDWAVWRFWPVYLLVPIAVFLLLQLLQLVVKKDAPSLRRVVSGESRGD